MQQLLAITFFLNIVFSLKEFFDVWDHIELTKLKGERPKSEDYIELWFAASLSLFTLFAFTLYCFR